MEIAESHFSLLKFIPFVLSRLNPPFGHSRRMFLLTGRAAIKLQQKKCKFKLKFDNGTFIHCSLNIFGL